MKGFKTQISKLEHNVESITNSDPNFKPIHPFQLDTEMDMINDTYEQYGSFANVDDESNSFLQSLTDNSRTHVPPQNSVMKEVLSEIESKDCKINTLELK